MTEWVLNASPREARGKGGARQLRREGMVPAVVYGLRDPISVKVNAHEVGHLVHLLHGVTRVVTLRVDADGGKSQDVAVLIKDVQTTAVGGHLLHIDFNEIDTKQTVRANVVVHPVGTAIGVKLGGTLQTVLHEVLVECLPSALPDAIEVDVSELAIGRSIHVSELNLPAGLRAITDPESAVFVVSGQMKEEEEAAPVAAAAEAVPGAAVPPAPGGEVPAKEKEPAPSE